MAFKATVASLAIALGPSVIRADEANIYNYSLGDHIIDYPLDARDVLDSEMNGYRGQSHIKLKGANGTQFALTFRRPSQTLQYIEHDWIDRNVLPSTSLEIPDVPEFQFGKTRIADLQRALDDTGFHYSCKQRVPTPDGFLSFLSFEVPSRPKAVYTFVVEYSQNLVQRGLVDRTNTNLGGAVLVGTIVSRPNYPKDFWCAAKIPFEAHPQMPKARDDQSFEDFLPDGRPPVDPSVWEVVEEPKLMISINGAVTWGDRMFIIPNPDNCEEAEVMVWAHTLRDKDLLALEGQEVDASFNLLEINEVHAPIISPVTLSRTLYAPIDGREWPPFAVGSFLLGSVDFKRYIISEHDPSIFGFSLEFGSDVAGMRDNFWSLEGLYKAGQEAMRLCSDRQMP